MEKIKLKGPTFSISQSIIAKKTPYQIVTLFLHFFGIGISIFFLSQTNKILCNESKISRLILKIYYNIRLSWKTLKTSRFLPFFDKIDIFFMYLFCFDLLCFLTESWKDPIDGVGSAIGVKVND